MKKLLYIFLSIFICAISMLSIVCDSTALALDSYLRIMSDDAIFYSAETLSSDSELFLLPRGYFVKVISQTEQKVYCEFADSSAGYSKVLGYVENKNLKSTDSFSPLYPKIQLTSLVSSPIFLLPNNNSKVVLSVFSGQTLSFYGFSKNKEFIFVLIGNDFGFIPASSVQLPVIPSHPMPMPTVIPSPTPSHIPTDIPPVQGALPQSMQILLVMFILVPVILLSVLIFKK